MLAPVDLGLVEQQPIEQRLAIGGNLLQDILIDASQVLFGGLREALPHHIPDLLIQLFQVVAIHYSGYRFQQCQILIQEFHRPVCEVLPDFISC